MAGAYGGAARGQVRRPGIKYDPERLKNSKKFRVSTAEEPKVRATLEKLAKSVSGFNPLKTQDKKAPPSTKHQGLMGQTVGSDSQDGRSQRSGPLTQSRITKNADSQAKVEEVRARGKPKKGLKDGDFERMFGKDIDQFLEDSEWDIESQFDDKGSQASRASGRSNAQEKLRAIEKLYLARLDSQPQGSGSALPNHPPSKKPKRPQSNSRMANMPNDSQMRRPRKIKPDPGPPRETIISFTDDPGVIHRGEILPFHTKKKGEQTRSRGPSAIGIGGESMSSNKGSPDRHSWKA